MEKFERNECLNIYKFRILTGRIYFYLLIYFIEIYAAELRKYELSLSIVSTVAYELPYTNHYF